MRLCSSSSSSSSTRYAGYDILSAVDWGLCHRLVVASGDANCCCSNSSSMISRLICAVESTSVVYRDASSSSSSKCCTPCGSSHVFLTSHRMRSGGSSHAAVHCPSTHKP
jgi:hypothetical protein